MARKCMECGRTKGLFVRNYAGFNAKASGSHSFPSRIETSLAGNPDADFLCNNCANKRQVVCSVHGPIAGKIAYGRPSVQSAQRKF